MRPERFQFPPMLGPPEEETQGSPAWGMRVAAQVEMYVDKVDQFGVDHLCRYLTQVLKEPVKPWEVWPDDDRSKTLDAFFPLCCGRTFDQIRALISDYLGDDDLTHQLDAAKARADGKHRGQGARTDLAEHHNNVMRSGRQGNDPDYLLRRLSRERPDILDAYERHEYPSVRKAAIAAGIITPPTYLEIAVKAYRKLSPEDKRRFQKELDLL